MGSGMAGISAADAALARGKKVMVFEKKPYQGGAVSNCPIAYLSIRNDKDFQNSGLDEATGEKEYVMVWQQKQKFKFIK